MSGVTQAPYLPAQLHKDARALLERIGQTAWSSLTPAEIRALPSILAPAPEAVGSVVQRGILGPGGWIRIRIYRPPGDGPFPGLVYFHGGGFVFGSLDGSDRLCRAFTARASVVTVSVDYRLAPETRSPGAHDDAYAAVEWVTSNAADLRIDPSRIALAGDSAGGNLAAATAVAARDRGGPPIALQVLLCPVTDTDFSGSDPAREFAAGPVMTAQDGEWCMDQYLTPEQKFDTRVALLRLPDLTRLPVALVITAECDPLRDQGEAYARRLREAGVQSEMRRYVGMFHNFFYFQVGLEQAREFLDELCADIRQRLVPG